MSRIHWCDVCKKNVDQFHVEQKGYYCVEPLYTHKQHEGVVGTFINPDTQKRIPAPFYRGDGNLSVNELQTLCKDFMEYCYQRQLQFQEKDKEIEKLKSDCERLANAITRLNKQDTEQYNKIIELKDQLEEKEKLVVVLKNRGDDHFKNLEYANTELNQLRSRLHSIKTKLESIEHREMTVFEGFCLEMAKESK